MYKNDHAPLHIHVFKDGHEVARYDLENNVFMNGSDPRHFGRVIRALIQAGLID